MALVVLLMVCGCEKSSPQPKAVKNSPDAAESLTALRSAMRRNQWQQAWELSNSVLTEHPDDPDALAAVAQVAYQNNKPDLAADLMSEACRLESFTNASRVHQGMAAILETGRIYDCIAFLEEAVSQQPLQHKTRRFLFDLYWGCEDRPRCLPHGRFLLSNRQFDSALLFALSDTEVRSESSAPLVEIVRNHPADNRPLTAEARILFDKGNETEAANLLRDILDRYPDHLPAIALMCRVLVVANHFDEFALLAATAPDGIQSYPAYWIAQGDWAGYRHQELEAVRAYWEAVRCDADSREAWLKLSVSLKRQTNIAGVVDDASIRAIDNRVMLLSRFGQSKSQMLTSGMNSQSSAVELAKITQTLGRLWEAEAWAAVAMTFPDDPSVPLVEVREAIIRSLNKETPWQSEFLPAALETYMVGLPLPRFDVRVPSRNDQNVSGKHLPSVPPSTPLALVNEATERKLNFFGRTGDRLDRPGVMLYQIVGCGGGAIDFDLDGWCDLYLAAAGGTPPNRDSKPNGLMRNQCGAFIDVTDDSKSGDTGFAQGISVGDVNEDGFPDLLVLNYGPNTLLINNGDGSFADASERLGEREFGATWSTSGAIADLDGDGLADITVINYCDGIKPVTQSCPQKDTNIIRACSPLVFPGAPDCFLHSMGNGSFVDQTSQWGAAPSIVGRGLGVTIGSFDDEPGVDVFIANDMTSNHYWNRSAGSEFRLHETAILRGLGSGDRSLAQGSMGIATGDLDRDGDFDFYVTNFANEYNTYHEQTGSGLWSDQTSRYQLYDCTLPFVGFGTQSIDFDNDGTLELVVSNGHVDSYPSSERIIPYAQLMQVFQRESGRYASIAKSIGGEYLNADHVGRALWSIDVNRDGKTDFAATHQTEPVALLINRTEDSGHWIEVQLIGRHCSRDAIGATIEIRSKDQRWVAAQTSGDGFLCSNERVIHTGLGNASGDCQVTVHWPDGKKQTFPSLAINARWLVVQSDPHAFQLNH